MNTGRAEQKSGNDEAGGSGQVEWPHMDNYLIIFRLLANKK